MINERRRIASRVYNHSDIDTVYIMLIDFYHLVSVVSWSPGPWFGEGLQSLL